MDKYIKKFIDDRVNPHNKEDVEKQRKYVIKIPCFREQTIYFKKNLKALLKRLNLKYEINLAFVTPKLKHFFVVKDKIPVPLASNVIYKFTYEMDSHQVI